MEVLLVLLLLTLLPAVVLPHGVVLLPIHRAAVLLVVAVEVIQAVVHPVHHPVEVEAAAEVVEDSMLIK